MGCRRPSGRHDGDPGCRPPSGGRPRARWAGANRHGPWLTVAVFPTRPFGVLSDGSGAPETHFTMPGRVKPAL